MKLSMRLWRRPRDGMYYAVFDGDRRRSLHTRDASEAKRIYAQIRKEWLSGKLAHMTGQSKSISLVVYKIEYIEWAERVQPRSTFRANRLALDKLIHHAGENTHLDRLTAGFQPSDLVIVAARPSMGKTALALNMASNAAKQGIPVGVFSLEMSKEQLVMRMLCSEARVDSHKLRTGAVFSQEKASLLDAAGNLAYLPILIDDSAGISPLEVRAKARRMSAEYSVGMIIIDYLQLMQGKRSEMREQEISDISRSLKALAKELNIPVIALSQLNRKVEERHNRRPVLSDLRESGAIEQDADVIAFIYRDEVYNPDSQERGVAEVNIAKQRNGPTGEVKLAYLNAYTRFENLARGYE